MLAAGALGLAVDELRPSTASSFRHAEVRGRDRDVYDANGRIVFMPIGGAVGGGLPRKAMKDDTSYVLTTSEGMRDGVAVGWEHVGDLREGIIS